MVPRWLSPAPVVPETRGKIKTRIGGNELELEEPQGSPFSLAFPS